MNHRAPQLPPNAATTFNYAAPGATIGIQAHEVRDSTIYQVFANDPAEKKYRVGLQYLEDGVPLKARELISAAIADGLRTAEVRFHWVLAMLSKRSYRDLSRAERGALNQIDQDLTGYAEGEYKTALEAIRELLCHLNGSDGDPEIAEKRILMLPAHLRSKVDRHLSEVLSGATKDKLWARRKEQALADQCARGRTGRVWAYFHPEPIRPRRRPVLPPQVLPSDWLRGAGSTLLFAIAFGYLGSLALKGGSLISISMVPVAVTAGYFGLRDAFVWSYRTARIRAEDHRLYTYPASKPPRGDGFAAEVTRSFERYFFKYCPAGVDSEFWIDRTASIRAYLRDEICEIYREQRVRIGRVNWLIGYLAQEVRRREQDRSLYAYRAELRVDELTKIRCLLALAVMLAAIVPVIAAATQASPLLAWLAFIVAAISSPFCALKWRYILSEQLRKRDDDEEAEERYADRTAAYRRWKQRLDQTRPTETEMETWLDCDKTMLADMALRHYRMSWRDVIAHAVFQGPAEDRKRHRDARGPWRYSHYDLRLFLITKDGVREVASELDFQRAAFNDQERNNFRFDAVSSVNVAESGGGGRTLKLTLTNGPTRDICVTEPEPTEHDQEEADDLLNLNLSAAGFTHALRILEGIAAEGKSWIDRDDTTSDPPD
jgi:hypothetical protein